MRLPALPRTLAAVAALAAAAACHPPAGRPRAAARAAAADSGCVPAHEAFAEHVRNYLAYLLSEAPAADDSTASAARRRWGLARLAPTAVRVVEDAAACRAAFRAYARARGADAERGARRVVLAAAGDRRFVVVEPPDLGRRTGHLPTLVFTPDFRTLVDTWW